MGKRKMMRQGGMMCKQTKEVEKEKAMGWDVPALLFLLLVVPLRPSPWRCYKKKEKKKKEQSENCCLHALFLSCVCLRRIACRGVEGGRTKSPAIFFCFFCSCCSRPSSLLWIDLHSLLHSLTLCVLEVSVGTDLRGRGNQGTHAPRGETGKKGQKSGAANQNSSPCFSAHTLRSFVEG